MTTEKNEADDLVCCPPFDPSRYDENKVVTWEDKLFLKETVRSFLYIPLTFGRATTRANTKIDKADAKTDECLLLDDFRSPWGSNIYVSCSKDVPEAEMTKISGTFMTKVYEGPYYKCGEWVKDTTAYVREKKGKDPIKIYANYTTCPKCAKQRGKNYVVMFAQVA